MNIIKLYDNLMPSDKNPKLADFFNKNLKGKYAYWIKMRYIFPLDSLSYQKYIEYEQKDNIFFLGSEVLPHIDMYSEEECLYDFSNTYIDICETEKINSIQDFYAANKYAIDYDLDINKLRNFRTWLATELYNFNIDENGKLLNKYTPEQMHVLEYYKNNMYNDVIKYLSIFGINTILPFSSESSCGCCNNTNLNTLNLNNIAFCDSVVIYKNNIHNAMVALFENVDFWKSINTGFLKLFKRYIDNIIKTGMKVSDKTENYSDCKCNYSNTSASEKILETLSISLGYIINNEISGHVNYIHDALHNWADKLYDYMNWNISNEVK